MTRFLKNDHGGGADRGGSRNQRRQSGGEGFLGYGPLFGIATGGVAHCHERTAAGGVGAALGRPQTHPSSPALAVSVDAQGTFCRPAARRPTPRPGGRRGRRRRQIALVGPRKPRRPPEWCVASRVACVTTRLSEARRESLVGCLPSGSSRGAFHSVLVDAHSGSCHPFDNPEARLPGCDRNNSRARRPHVWFAGSRPGPTERRVDSDFDSRPTTITTHKFGRDSSTRGLKRKSTVRYCKTRRLSVPNAF